MKLRYVDIKNFRSIADAVIEFNPRCRVLVGINESGKSNILEALALLDEDREIHATDLRVFPDREKPDQPAFVRFVFGINALEVLKISRVAASRLLADKPSKQPILSRGGKSLTLWDFAKRRGEVLYRVDIRERERHSTYWGLGQSGYEVVGNWKKPLAETGGSVTLPDGNTRPINSFSIINCDHYPDLDGSDLVAATPEDFSALVGLAAKEYLDENMPTCIYWAYNESSLLPPHIDVQAFAANPDICVPLREMFALSRYRHLLSPFRSMYPGFGAVQLVG